MPARKNQKFHGYASARTPEYNAWTNFRQRCMNPTDRKYRDYGGRGITVDPRWDDFAQFLEDMGERPSDAHSIDRIDNDGPYSPENCRWATIDEQRKNQRDPMRVIDVLEYAATLLGLNTEDLRAAVRSHLDGHDISQP